MYEGPEMSIMTLATADVPDLGKPKPGETDPSLANKPANQVVSNEYIDPEEPTE